MIRIILFTLLGLVVLSDDGRGVRFREHGKDGVVSSKTIFSPYTTIDTYHADLGRRLGAAIR